MEKNCLRINGEEIPFLAEHELPKKAREVGKEPDTNAAQKEAPTNANVPSSSQPKGKTDYPESSIKLLTDLGVSREEAIGALEAAGGNPELAVSLLFQ